MWGEMVSGKKFNILLYTFKWKHHTVWYQSMLNIKLAVLKDNYVLLGMSLNISFLFLPYSAVYLSFFSVGKILSCKSYCTIFKHKSFDGGYQESSRYIPNKKQNKQTTTIIITNYI